MVRRPGLPVDPEKLVARMEIIDIPLEGRADMDGLRAFLSACLDAANEDGHDKIASITLSVKHIDPLAVLDSIYEGDAHHFYMENPYREWAVAGAEAVVSASWNGPDRFQQARTFAAGLDEHVIAIGDLSLPFSGPLFFAGFSFYDSVDGREEAFPGGQVFVPQWQVARAGDHYVAVANALIRPGMDVEAVAQRIWSAHRKFSAYTYDQPPRPPVYHILEEREVGPEGTFLKNVALALEAIKKGSYNKIVLSRAVDLLFDNSCQPLKILNRLRRDYPRCSSFSLQSENGTSFIGATPERLVSVDNGRYTTEAIAGSAARDPSAGEDARLARDLLASEKDLREHGHVVESIRRRLESLGLEARIPDSPGLLVLPNVQHLRTPINGPLKEGVHILDLAEALHPTPAVGGTPREDALKDIFKWEPFPRGMFAGLTGWFDLRGNGEFAVGIRSALVRDSRARLFAGAGIVEGSIPEMELRETTLKMEALLRCIRGAAG
ncbi:isochorismate synthase [Puniceicoccales bacterium CK1056]|uniref:isochorismate synthase n=1 Tax=Oceanipulchritudo coccoides TaxID=2706888 RepID=A0A6B2M2Y7_9BACT|nr:isochorismate synthase [Oceanipulchritudo coccoides]NDV62464.1 isochorismate synthase [Oceanipulchritudo coccoides]